MATKKTGYASRRGTQFKRLTVDLPVKLYRLFLRSEARKNNVTDSAGLRELLRTALGEQ